MAQRPTRLPRWAYAAPGGQLVEPPSSFARLGYFADERPPAQWINYQLHFAAAWADYLAGPGWGAWERTAHGGSAPTFTGIAGLAVDADDATAALARRRYVLAGATSGGLALAVSRTGREWIARSPPGTATELHGVLAVGSYFLLWGLAGSVAAMWRTQRDDVVPSVSSAITLDDGDLWSLVGSFSAPTTGVAAVVWNGTARVGRLLRLANAFAFAFSDDDGATWSAVFDGSGLVSGAVASGLAWDAVRGRWLAASDKGDVALLTVGSNWTLPVLLPSMPTTARVHLRAGGGLCIAWASVDRTEAPLAASVLWRSEDGGETWTAVSLPSAWGATLTDVTYADGVWVATTTAAPYLWRSDDGGATWERVALPLGEEASWALHLAVYADGAVTATGLTWTVATTRATGLAPDASRVYSPEPGYLADAGYLRGRRIAATAPTDGQGLVWDATGGVWTPTTPAAALPDPSAISPGHHIAVLAGAWTTVDGYSGAGLPLVMAATTFEGDGTEKIKAFTPLVPFVSGRRYRINGVICVWTSAGAHLATIRIVEFLLHYTGSAWAAIPSGETHIATSAGIDTYFARAGSTHTADELPGLLDDSGALSIAATPLSGQTIRVEFRGTVADFGAAL